MWEIRNFVYDLLFDILSGMLDKRMMKSLIWLMWVRYKILIN